MKLYFHQGVQPLALTKFPDFSLTFPKIHFFPDLQQNSLTFPWLLPSLEFPWLFPDRWTPCHGLVQERRNSIANSLELRLSWTKSLIWMFVTAVTVCYLDHPSPAATEAYDCIWFYFSPNKPNISYKLQQMQWIK